MGVIFFVYNAIFALVLLLLVLIASFYAIFSKNPDTRYQPMRDDRGSFIKSQNNLHTTELDALGATARGDMKEEHYGKSRFDDEDDESFSSASRSKEAGDVPATSAETAYHDSPVEHRPASAAPSQRTAPPPNYDQRGMYAQPNPSSVSGLSGNGYNTGRSQTASPAPAPYGRQPYGQNQYGNYNSGGGYSNNSGYAANADQGSRAGSQASYQRPTYQPQYSQPQQQSRQQQTPSPWQRGAGYDH